uniref:Lipocalin/cytosolic fatty-acid binding domain-containing protein n=1 Tax=Homalodisca liturata TaxID=320908 RepID=A0A1B6ILR3_9HEMI
MASLYILLVLPIFAVLRVEATGKCNPDIIRKIQTTNNCPWGVLAKLDKMGVFTQAVLPAAEVPDVVKCWSGSVDFRFGPFSRAHANIYFKDGSVKRVGYNQMELFCGQVNESFEGANYKIYFLNIDDTSACYYRCQDDDNAAGEDFGGCVIPVSKVGDPTAQAAIATCKQSLADVGVTTQLQDLQLCTK